MNNITNKIIKSLQQAARPAAPEEILFIERYLGTKKKSINVKSADRDKILRSVAGELRELPPEEAIDVLDDLFASDIVDHINFAGKILSTQKTIREVVSFKQIEKWLSTTTGWLECDCICQSLMEEQEVLDRWDEWRETINRFSSADNIQLRRASLVLQAKPVRESGNQKLRQLAYKTIEKLKGENDILITKAISWLLRELSRANKSEVQKYIQKNQHSLPKIAYRETMKKITTGKK